MKADFTDIKVFVRHSKDCTWDGLESTKKDCKCRKHLRWRQNGKQYRRKAGTRSWAKAELAKRELEDQLSGKADSDAQFSLMSIVAAAEAFAAEKKAELRSQGVQRDYKRLTLQFSDFAKTRGVYNVNGITRDLLTAFVSNWTEKYPSGNSRVLRRTQLKAFLKFCCESKWLARVPKIVEMAAGGSSTKPLDAAEYRRLLDAVYCTINRGPQWQHAAYSCIQLLRWTGLAPIDAITLRRDKVTFDAAKNLYHVSARRSKTGVPILIPISKQVGDDLLKVAVSESPLYFFWSGNCTPQSATANWTNRYIRPCFAAAGIPSSGHMLSYRLRDTFAVHLLEQGASMENVACLLGNSIRICEKHYADWSKLRQDKVDAFVSTTFEKTPTRRNRPTGRKVTKN